MREKMENFVEEKPGCITAILLVGGFAFLAGIFALGSYGMSPAEQIAFEEMQDIRRAIEYSGGCDDVAEAWRETEIYSNRERTRMIAFAASLEMPVGMAEDVIRRCWDEIQSYR